MSVWECDWTHWQGKPLPAQQVANEGFGLVKIKAGGASKEGWTFIDPTFYESAEALLAEPRLIPGVFWYLMPGNPHAQAGLFLDTLVRTGDADAWAAYVDVEQAGLSWFDFLFFVKAWHGMTSGKTLSVYANRHFWTANMGEPQNTEVAARLCPVLEEARWVPESVRKDPARPYASQQAKAIPDYWWDSTWWGGTAPAGIQFTDNALVAGKRTSAAKYSGSAVDLRARLL